jgi:hypothetical protein
VAYEIIVYLYISYFQLFPGNRESLIYLPARGTSTGEMVTVFIIIEIFTSPLCNKNWLITGWMFPVFYGRVYDIVCIR